MEIGERDRDLRERAKSVIPGGLWGHMNVNGFIAGYPQFFERGEGAELWDVDGRRFVDFMCSWGPNILGHHHPAVEDAAARQRSLGDAMNGPGAVLVELAELLVETIPFADWVLFQKNGGDATTACVTIARAGTGRRKILVAKGAYHGAVPWCSPSLAGVTTEDRAHLIPLRLQRRREPEGRRRAGQGRSGGHHLHRLPARLRQGPGLGQPRFRSGRAGDLHARGRRPDRRRRPRRFPARSRRHMGDGGSRAGPLGLQQGGGQRLRAGGRGGERAVP